MRDVAVLEKPDQLPRLLRVLAQQAGQLSNFSQLGGQIGLDDKSTRKYLGVLEQLFLVRHLEPWHRNHLSRLLKTPKLHFLDSGLLAALTDISTERLRDDRAPLGALLETFVHGEILKAVHWSGGEISLYHYRDKDQHEVDLVLEDSRGQVVGIEVKASASVRDSDFAGLRRLAQAAGKSFCLGLVLHDGERLTGFGEQLFAAPLAYLWD